MDGTVKDGEKIPGVMDTLRIHNHTLFGNRDISSTGLVQAVEKLTTVFKMGAAVLGTLQVVLTISWMLFTHFHK